MKDDFIVGDKFKCKDQTLYGYWKIVDIVYTRIGSTKYVVVSYYVLKNGSRTIHQTPMHLKTFFRKVG